MQKETITPWAQPGISLTPLPLSRCDGGGEPRLAR
jgi:hypothetical protein